MGTEEAAGSMLPRSCQAQVEFQPEGTILVREHDYFSVNVQVKVQVLPRFSAQRPASSIQVLERLFLPLRLCTRRQPRYRATYHEPRRIWQCGWAGDNDWVMVFPRSAHTMFPAESVDERMGDGPTMSRRADSGV